MIYILYRNTYIGEKPKINNFLSVLS